jgi:hypothetical protein
VCDDLGYTQFRTVGEYIMQGNRLAIEGALERGQLWAAIANGRYWLLRRNGKTQLWKTKPNAFSIPVKAGLKTCARIDQASHVACVTDANWEDAVFVVSETNPTNFINELKETEPTVDIELRRKLDRMGR